MSKWITAWGVPTSYVDSGIGNILEDTTFRHFFYSSIRGEKVRLRFSNRYGSEDIVIDEVRIAEKADGLSCISAETNVKVTFNDNGNVIKMGSELLSDEISFTLEPKKMYAISFYIKGFSRLETGYNKYVDDVLAPCWLARGNFVDEKELPKKCRKEIKNYICFCGIDAESTDDTKSIMAFGDSITARPWPDYLARRMNEEGIYNRSVVRKAIGGNRVLRDYRDCLARRGMGYAAVDRFEMSIKQVVGVDTVVMLEGINDLYHPQKTSLFSGMNELPTAEELIQGYKKCCDIAHKYGAKYYLCTILPTHHMIRLGDGREDIRQAVNKWIRTNDYVDGYIEFDKVLADKDNPAVLAKEYDSGDRLHPNIEGSMELCKAIPEYIYK